MMTELAVVESDRVEREVEKWIPMSAAAWAGRSFRPSPSIATVWPWERRVVM